MTVLGLFFLHQNPNAKTVTKQSIAESLRLHGERIFPLHFKCNSLTDIPKGYYHVHGKTTRHPDHAIRTQVKPRSHEGRGNRSYLDFQSLSAQ